MIVELLRPGGTDLARRWLAALLVVPADEREGVVEAIETRVVEQYASNPENDLPIARSVRVEPAARPTRPLPPHAPSGASPGSPERPARSQPAKSPPRPRGERRA